MPCAKNRPCARRQSAAAYNAEPRLTEIDRSLSSIGASLAIAALSGADVTILKSNPRRSLAKKEYCLINSECRI